MARVQAYVPINMRDFRSTVGRVTHADPHLLIVETRSSDTYYSGDFSYPGRQWRGEISSIETYEGNRLSLSIHGLELSTKFATVGTSRKAAVSTALKADDMIFGSGGRDKLSGFRGDDRLFGGRGNDKILGDAGDDVITGGKGNDKLKGGAGADMFVFGGSDGTDRILDFDPGEDQLHIKRGANRFSDLDIEQHGHDVTLHFGRTTVELLDVDADDLAPSDFIF